ncbi:putative RNA-binding protein [Zopfochytrium polystomum]|nr:putative RNA-binding protein [Zopfochytrium polystomum]
MTKQGWEDSEFPILCETCLGDNPYVRMTRQSYAKECKICSRPFTVFRWCPGAGMRYKKTEICQTCAKIKNVCQTCVLDLEYGLPVQVRDSVLNVEDSVPRSDVNREYFVQKVEGQLGATDTLVNYGKATSIAKETLKKMARVEPYYKRNRAHICSFYVKGECKRGEECPYRHELPVESDLSHQNIKDRYYGHNDPVAKKMLARNDKALSFPMDKSIMTLYLTGVDHELSQPDLKAHFLQYGDIKSVVLVSKSKCAFINFASRAAAEAAIEKTGGLVAIKGHEMRVQWGKGRPIGPKDSSAVELAEAPGSVDGFVDPDTLPAVPPPPGAGQLVYASTDPRLLGSSAKTFRPDD